MAPQAELCVPKSEPIPVRKISPSSMAAFFKEFHPSLELDPVPTYPEIFSKLRGLPLDEQKKLLVGFYSQKVEAFPNGAELGRFLARINNISWFQPKSPPDEESLERLCHQTLSRLNLHDLPLRFIRQSWVAAREAEWHAHDKANRAWREWFALSDADGDPTRGSVSDEVLVEARWAAQSAITPLHKTLAKVAAAAHDAWAHVETRDAALDATLKGALLDAGKHPEDPAWYAEAAVNAVVAWNKAREAALPVARDAAHNAAEAVLDAAHTEVLDAAWYRNKGLDAIIAKDLATTAATLNAARAAEWIVVKDLMPQRGYDKGNPFEPLMGIYELGCWPIEISDQNEETEFVIFVPPIQKIT